MLVGFNGLALRRSLIIPRMKRVFILIFVSLLTPTLTLISTLFVLVFGGDMEFAPNPDLEIEAQIETNIEYGTESFPQADPNVEIVIEPHLPQQDIEGDKHSSVDLQTASSSPRSRGSDKTSSVFKSCGFTTLLTSYVSSSSTSSSNLSYYSKSLFSFLSPRFYEFSCSNNKKQQNP